MTPAFERMSKTGRFSVHLRATVDRIENGSLILFDAALDTQPLALKADVAVMVGYQLPRSELAGELKAKGFEVHRIGDALSPRYIEGAIRDGYLAAMAL